MAGDGKISNRVVAVSCAAVLAVYAAGYARTREAAEQFEEQSAERRPASRQLPATGASAEIASVAEPGRRAEETSAPSREAARSDASTEIVASAPSTAPSPTATSEPEPAAPTAPEPVAVVASSPAAPAPSAPAAPAPAPAPAPTAAPAPAAAKSKWKDGTWHGWGTSRHGDIQAEVVIKDGKIAKSTISQCLTRYSCDVIDILIPQPVQRQSPDVDYVSRATQSSDAYYYAVLEALEASAK
ncbi:MAG: hypothetical protein RL328_524 [Acidobacteriota bacterium]|jgi:uncharacterized protein with FMN-binding domain